ncbi:hypothetical protein BH23ACT5_BH23ACT5_16360 [soil metagenome]
MERLNECECGKPLELCVEAWGECLALEIADVRYWALHHLTVSAFMLQHPRRLSLRGWMEERPMLKVRRGRLRPYRREAIGSP